MQHTTNATRCVFVEDWRRKRRHTDLHEGDEQEEGVGRTPDLLVQEPGQEGKYSIFGRTAAEHREIKIIVNEAIKNRKDGAEGGNMQSD